VTPSSPRPVRLSEQTQDLSDELTEIMSGLDGSPKSLPPKFFYDERGSALFEAIYGLALHLRVTMGWRGRRLAWILVFAVLGVLISFWGVNLVMDSSNHLFNVD